MRNVFSFFFLGCSQETFERWQSNCAACSYGQIIGTLCTFGWQKQYDLWIINTFQDFLSSDNSRNEAKALRIILKFKNTTRIYTVKANVLLRHFYYFKTAATSCTAYDSYKNMIPKLSCEERRKWQRGEIEMVLFSFNSFFTLVLYLLSLSQTVFFHFSIWFSSSDGLWLVLSSLCYFFNSPPHPTSFLSRPFFHFFLPQQCTVLCNPRLRERALSPAAISDLWLVRTHWLNTAGHSILPGKAAGII